MEENINIPTFEEIIDFLGEYGWNYRDTTSDHGERVILTNFALDDNSGVLISLHVNEEFVMVSTVKLMTGLNQEDAVKLLILNDILKLVKVYGIEEEGNIEAEVGFELWAGAWNKETFFSFMDMLCMGIQRTLDYLEEEGIEYSNELIEYEGN